MEQSLPYIAKGIQKLANANYVMIIIKIMELHLCQCYFMKSNVNINLRKKI